MSEHIILVESVAHWKPRYPAHRVVSARDYLADPAWSEQRGMRVINLCRTQRYLGEGYYCSLLAEARGHKVIPSVKTIQDLRRKSLYSLDTPDLDRRVQRILGRRKGITPTSFELGVQFGECTAADMQPFARELFELFRAPLLKVEFRLDKVWRIGGIKTLAVQSLDKDEEAPFFDALDRYLSRRWRSPRSRTGARYDLAILHDPEEALPPSSPKALKSFIRASKSLDVSAELITRRDFGRLAEFDALFIRETTAVDHHTYRFARKAASEGMAVIDDPESMIRCTNKIYLAELLRIHRIPAPRTLILRPGNLDELERTIPYPVVIKVPDGSFSRGVLKVDDRPALEAATRRLFKDSDLLLAQEYTYTPFDWRVGVLNRRPLFVCKYHMAAEHWQIIDHSGPARKEGGADTLPVEAVPARVVRTALKAANLIGDGLYGVDLKETRDGVLVIEVNDNPNIDTGIEDRVAGEGLYRAVIEELVRRIDARARPDSSTADAARRRS
ncbi:MAG: RimK family protein [Chromatiales bacterium]|jgi:glutathione synthase/RimK-type ligase-like ATP-grasp enzyme